jgi:phenylpropionate dioxygenase-like ring-hydroxylating dioxygenase large terminal subunit
MDSKLTDQSGRAYGLPQPHFEPVLVQVGPRTPGGELLRRYWQPVALSSEATTLPKAIRRFGEDLVLFRTQSGEPGLLYPRCVHRGTSLVYGRVEEDGIRCCYHGWKFSNQGVCLDQPCEPSGGPSRHRVRQPWYPVIEQFGAIWAYMGPPGRQPLFPIFSSFEGLAPGETVQASYFSANGEIQPFPVDHNWFQTYDNATDHYHVPILHARNSGRQFPDPRISEKIPDEVRWKIADDGRSILTVTRRVIEETGQAWMRIEQGIMPNMLALPPFAWDGPAITVTAFVPLDDTNFVMIDITRNTPGTQEIAPHDTNGWGFGPERKLWGQMSFEYHQRNPLDYEAQNGQGRITWHSQEHLVSSDRGIGMHRQLYKKQCKAVGDGADPVGVAYQEGDRLVRVEARSWVEPA